MFTLDHNNALIIRHNQFKFFNFEIYKETHIRNKKKKVNNNENI